MKLNKLTIELGRCYDAHAGKYKTEMEYEGETGKVSMTLDPEVSNALLVCIGEVITKFAAQASKQIEASIITSIQEAKAVQQIEA